MPRTPPFILALAGLAATAVVAAMAPVISPTAAAWVEGEWATAALGASAFDCGTDPDYSTTASATGPPQASHEASASRSRTPLR